MGEKRQESQGAKRRINDQGATTGVLREWPRECVIAMYLVIPLIDSRSSGLVIFDHIALVVELSQHDAFRIRDWKLNMSFRVEAGVSPSSSHGRVGLGDLREQYL